MRGAPFLDLPNPSLVARLAPRRKLLVQTLMLPRVLSIRVWCGAAPGSKSPLGRGGGAAHHALGVLSVFPVLFILVSVRLCVGVS